MKRGGSLKATWIGAAVGHALLCHISPGCEFHSKIWKNNVWLHANSENGLSATLPPFLSGLQEAQPDETTFDTASRRLPAFCGECCFIMLCCLQA
jgi:hypothetical protein